MARGSTQGNAYDYTARLAMTLAIIAVLYFGRELFVPFALATLLSFLLTPLANRLQRWGLSTLASTSVAVSLGCFAVFGVGWIFTNQLLDLAAQLPSYRTNIVEKIHALNPSEHGVFARLQQEVELLNAEIDSSGQTPDDKAEHLPADAKTARSKKPVQVEIVPSGGFRLYGMLPGVVTPLFSLLANASVVLLFVFFMLLERRDLRSRFIRLIGASQINVTTQAINDAAKRVSKYLVMQLVINGSYGVALAVGLYLIGVPNAILWGVLSGLLRYVPYIGPVVAAVCPIVLSFAAFHGWTQPALTVALFVGVELISNNVLEPLLYRSSTGVSNIGLIAAAIFWTWLWGPVGLMLATPLTVCIAVMGRYAPHMEFLNVLLSDEPVLPPGAHYYQRLLAEDEGEAQALCEKYLEDHSLESLYDDVLLPALALSEADAHHDVLEAGKQVFIRESMRETMEELFEQQQLTLAVPKVAAEPADPAVERLLAARSVLCLPARDDADELAALMLSQVLILNGVPAEVLSVKSLASEMLERVAADGVGAVCVSAVPPFATSHSRYLCKRLRARFPNLRIVVGIWGASGASRKLEQQIRSASADRLVHSLVDAVAQAIPGATRPQLSVELSANAKPAA